MPSSCCAINCTNRHSKKKGPKFYRFPKDPERRRRWVAAIRREGWQPNDGSRICGAHFVSSMSNRFLSYCNDLTASILSCLHNFTLFTDDTYWVQCKT